jgi:hypothetical protein
MKKGRSESKRIGNDFKILGSNRKGKHRAVKGKTHPGKNDIPGLFLLSAAVVYKFDAEYAIFLLALAGKIMFLVSAIGVIYFGPQQLQKFVK